LQQNLQALGFLPKDMPINGAYGQVTRTAIIAWQTARGRAATGLIGDDDARALGGEIAALNKSPGAAGSIQPSLPPQSGAQSSNPPAGHQDVISMVLEHGTYWVPVMINDVLKLDFAVDSGAADVQITRDVVRAS
jgi:peptidoglycan hydrolase-like protein with peptidoglycan-binding domain